MASSTGEPIRRDEGSGEPWHDAAVTTTDAFAALSDLPGVFEATDGVRAAVDALLREPAMRRDRGRVRAAARTEASWASAVLEGADVSFEVFRRHFDESVSEDDLGTSDAQLCSASMRANANMRTLSDTWRAAPLQALAKLHSVVAADVGAGDELGRPRPAPLVTARLNTLAEQVTTTKAPGVVVYGVVQGELLDLRPFGWGDGLVARAASRLVLVARGVDPDALTVPERGLLNLGQGAYEAKLAAYRRGRPPEWLSGWCSWQKRSAKEHTSLGRSLAPDPRDAERS